MTADPAVLAGTRELEPLEPEEFQRVAAAIEVAVPYPAERQLGRLDTTPLGPLAAASGTSDDLVNVNVNVAVVGLAP